MAKRASAGMRDSEKLAGLIFFLVYLLVMPLLYGKILLLTETLLGIDFSPAEENSIYYYLLFVVTMIIFHNFIWQNVERFIQRMAPTLGTVGLGLVVFYGCNELFYRVVHLLFGHGTNLNDMTIAAQISAVPRMTALIVIVLAPFVEEVLFRGLVFGFLREKNRLAAYAVSALLFAFLQVWQFALSGGSAYYLILALQYLIPGLLFAWSYDRSGNLWGSILLHMAVNSLALWVG